MNALFFFSGSTGLSHKTYSTDAWRAPECWATDFCWPELLRRVSLPKKRTEVFDVFWCSVDNHGHSDVVGSNRRTVWRHVGLFLADGYYRDWGFDDFQE